MPIENNFNEIELAEHEEKIIMERAFIEGLITGIKRFAWWNNGEQFVGTKPWPLKQAIETAVAEYKKRKEI